MFLLFLTFASARICSAPLKIVSFRTVFTPQTAQCFHKLRLCRFPNILKGSVGLCVITMKECAPGNGKWCSILFHLKIVFWTSTCNCHWIKLYLGSVFGPLRQVLAGFFVLISLSLSFVHRHTCPSSSIMQFQWYSCFVKWVFIGFC